MATIFPGADGLSVVLARIDATTYRALFGARVTPDAADRFSAVTGQNGNGRFAIIVDGVVNSAPVIRDQINGGRASITMGQGNPRDQIERAKALARGLKAAAAR